MNWRNYPIREVAISDKSYPSGLKKISNPPTVLYYRGNLSEAIFKKSLAVVGSRWITSYGKIVVEKFVSFLVSSKITIISGFMYGVDSQAHQKCLDYGGITVSVFGCGLNIVYPPENQKLYSQILESGGAVLSEYPPEAKPHLWTYPQRNRIVAGISTLGVLVVEAGEKSGSLITTRLAAKMGKNVFAVPGPITSSTSIGSNLLIKRKEAKMVLDPQDLLDTQRERYSKNRYDSQLGLIERKILESIKREPLTIDELSQLLDKSVVEVSQTLSMMSLRGLVSESLGKFYLA